MTRVMLSPGILVVRFGSIADILLATPLLRAIRQRYPHARLNVLTRRRHVPLLIDSPHLDEVIGIAPRESPFALVRRLRHARYTYLLDLEGTTRSRMLRLLVPGRWRTAPQYRLARELLVRTKRNLYPEDMPVAERFFDAARDLEVEPDGGPPEFFIGPEAERNGAGWLERAQLGNGRPLVAFAPGASQATKRWPLEHWVSLVRRVCSTGADAVLVGGAPDGALATEIAARSSRRAVSAAGVLGLQATGAVLKRSAALVAGQTASMHIATAVGTPVVALAGPTVRAFGYYPYNAPRSVVLERNLPCRPCAPDGGPECPLRHHFCMVEITPDTTFSALARVLA
ncbi:MAG TPA: glycosyltransferase family 9 protein [Gemmatimonadales bacterium]|nr:glycosyltransferase family 9 protein [Gemmatimonadales bacterium]